MSKFRLPKYVETYHTLFAKICLLVVSYEVLYFSYLAFVSPITPGDSTGYHIPIALSILDGSFLNPNHIFAGNPVMYYPGSSEAILSVFMLLGLPINLYNILALICLFVASYFLGKQFFNQNKSLSVIFATSIVTLPVIQRWIVTQFVDYWYAVFFVLLLYLLEEPKKTLTYTLFLGITTGLIIGTKYSGPLIVVILFGVYLMKLVKIATVQRVSLFLMSTFIFGGFWYVRNLIFTGNPYFPQNVFAHDQDFLKFKVIDAISKDPYLMFNALLSEYLLWVFLVVLVPLTVYLSYKHLTKFQKRTVARLCIITVLSCGVFFILPSEPGSYTHYISTYRYTLTMFIPFILLLFYLMWLQRWYIPLYIFVFITFFSLPSLTHHPKLIFLLIPPAYIIALYPRYRGIS